MRRISSLFFLVGLVLAATAAAEVGVTSCARAPDFALARGITAPIVSTSDRARLGLVLLSFTASGQMAPPLQLPSWRSGGRLGGFAVTERGDIFVVPVPNVNTLENPPERQNWLYRVRSADGELEVFAKLPVSSAPSQKNPYGLVGIVYDCELKLLYVTTVSGSIPAEQRGKVFVVDAATGAVKDELVGWDAIGVGVVPVGGMRWLYLGSARRAQILRVALMADGRFDHQRAQPEVVLDLDEFNVIRARKIRFLNNVLTVEGTEFYYNLVAQTEFEQPSLKFRWHEGRWERE